MKFLQNFLINPAAQGLYTNGMKKERFFILGQALFKFLRPGRAIKLNSPRAAALHSLRERATLFRDCMHSRRGPATVVSPYTNTFALRGAGRAPKKGWPARVADRPLCAGARPCTQWPAPNRAAAPNLFAFARGGKGNLSRWGVTGLNVAPWGASLIWWLYATIKPETAVLPWGAKPPQLPWGICSAKFLAERKDSKIYSGKFSLWAWLSFLGLCVSNVFLVSVIPPSQRITITLFRRGRIFLGESYVTA